MDAGPFLSLTCSQDMKAGLGVSRFRGAAAGQAGIQGNEADDVIARSEVLFSAFTGFRGDNLKGLRWDSLRLKYQRGRAFRELRPLF